MGIRAWLTDKATGESVQVDDDGGNEKKSLVVATRPIKTFNNRPFYFITTEGSKDMNVAVAFGGAPDKVHDGIDSVLWTGSQPVGGADITFDSAAQNHTAAGGKSVYFNRLDVDDVGQFAKGSDINLANYAALTMWVYVDNNWLPGDSIAIYGWDSAASAMVGNEILLEEYFDYATHDVWQKVAIGLADFGLASATTVDALRFRQVSVQDTAARWYLDDIQFEQTGVPVDFIIKPEKGTWLYLNCFNITIVDEYDATLLNNSVPNIPYDGFLGVPTLPVGIIAKRLQHNTVMFYATFKNFIDFMGLPKMSVVGCGSDGVNTWVKIAQPMAVPLILKSEDDDKFIYTIRDDLSGLKKLWISVACYEERR